MSKDMAKRAYIWHSKFTCAKDISGTPAVPAAKKGKGKGRCELCGISAKVKVLQVDHINQGARPAQQRWRTFRHCATHAMPPRSRIKTTTLTLESGEKMYV
jgi:hypothetical protein